MLDVDKSLCCGCSACISVCPKKCIEFFTDEEGFDYPRVIVEKCINCGKCETVCPVIHASEPSDYIEAFAARNKNVSIQLASSSGGVFYALAEKIISNGGAVAGVSWSSDFFSAKFDIAETLDDVKTFMTSKYLQAEMNDIYCRSKKILQTGRKLLFCGTPCQISGLRHFLNKEYSNLYTVEVICHGVPSPELWRRYLKSLIKKYRFETIETVNFRDKNKAGQKCYHLLVNGNTAKSVSKEFSQKFTNNIYMKAFVQNLSLRPSCYNCQAKMRKSGSDITIGDFWGLGVSHPELDDDKGVSCVIVNTAKGSQMLQECCSDLIINEVEYRHVFYGNPMLESCVAKPVKREQFWKSFSAGGDIEKLLHNMTKDSLGRMIRKVSFGFAVRVITWLGLKPLVKKIAGR